MNCWNCQHREVCADKVHNNGADGKPLILRRTQGCGAWAPGTMVRCGSCVFATWDAKQGDCRIRAAQADAGESYLPTVGMDWGCWEGVPQSALNRCNEQQKADK